MGMFAITIRDNGVKAKLKALENAANNMRPVFERVGAAVLTQVQLGFKTTTSPWGEKWVKPKTRKGQALTDKGILRRSIRSRADDTGVTVGTNVKYARIHQFGGTIKHPGGTKYIAIGKNKAIFVSNGFIGPVSGVTKPHDIPMPRRSYLPIRTNGQIDLPETWQKSILSRIKAHFMDAVKKAGA